MQVFDHHRCLNTPNNELRLEYTQKVILCAQEYLHNKTMKIPKTAASSAPPPAGYIIKGNKLSTDL